MKGTISGIQIGLLLLSFSWVSNAQFQGKVFEQFNDASVIENTNTLNSPWCGGINSVQINHVDLNNDGKSDLILYDHITNIVKTFINTGNVGDMKYVYDPIYESNFPPLRNYLILKDYNCDGIPDLFHKGFPGVSVYKGYYQANELKFTYYKDLYFPTPTGLVNVYVQPDDIPAIIDVDGDGDLDVVSFDQFGIFLVFVKNMQVENGLPCDSMQMKLTSNCYGKFSQGIWRTVHMNIPDSMCQAVPLLKKERHTGNCIALLDIDGDNDLDFLGGNISYSDAQLLTNTGTSALAQYTVQDTLYNSSSTGHSVYMPTWAAPFHVDIDNDNDKDILFTCHNENLSSANYHAIAFYKNIGSDINPNFVYQHDSLFTPDMIDVGSYSYPVFFDFNKDGKKDLFIGNEGILDNASGIQHSMLAYYKNTSTIGSVSFELVTKDFLGLSAYGYKGIFPCFGDITGDGKDDLLFGGINGNVCVYKNYASSNTIPPNFIFSTDSIPSVTVGKYSAPLVYDFNQDGKNDLLVGNEAGKLAYYQDTSSTSVKKLSLQTISLGNFKAGDVSNIYGYCVPFIGKIDNTNQDFLLIGNIDGTIARYDSFANNLGNFHRSDSNYSLIKAAPRSVPAVDDLDGDGKYEMLVGNKLGGLTYYKQVKDVVANATDIALSNTSIEIYPNPSNDVLSLLFKTETGNTKMNIDVLDLTGNLILHQDYLVATNASINVSSLSSGMYFIHITLGKNKIVKKFIKSEN